MDDVGLSTPFNPSIEVCAGAQLLFNETKEVQKDQVELMGIVLRRRRIYPHNIRIIC